MAYSKNKSLGISRPPSAYALWCKHVKAKGTKLPVRRRLCDKTIINERKNIQTRWAIMSPEEKLKFEKEFDSIVQKGRQDRVDRIASGQPDTSEELPGSAASPGLPGCVQEPASPEGGIQREVADLGISPFHSPNGVRFVPTRLLGQGSYGEVIAVQNAWADEFAVAWMVWHIEASLSMSVPFHAYLLM